jgi:hypothetical protein
MDNQIIKILLTVILCIVIAVIQTIIENVLPISIEGTRFYITVFKLVFALGGGIIGIASYLLAIDAISRGS